MNVTDDELDELRDMVKIGWKIPNAVVHALIDRLDRAEGREPTGWLSPPRVKRAIDALRSDT